MIYNTPWFGVRPDKLYGGGFTSLGDHHPDTIVKMADFEHIVAIKWTASDDYEYEEMERFSHIFNVLDNNTDPILCHKLGGRGYIYTFNDSYPSHDIEIWNLLEEPAVRPCPEALRSPQDARMVGVFGEGRCEVRRHRPRQEG